MRSNNLLFLTKIFVFEPYTHLSITKKIKTGLRRDLPNDVDITFSGGKPATVSTAR